MSEAALGQVAIRTAIAYLETQKPLDALKVLKDFEELRRSKSQERGRT